MNRTTPTCSRPMAKASPLHLLLGLVLSGISNAATIPDVPLQTMTTVEPNVMMTLDDSGSMQFEVMPDDYTYTAWLWTGTEWVGGTSFYVYPRANGIYGSSDYSNAVATVDWTNPYAAIVRSPQVNTVYYNPSITYSPWVDSSGVSLGNANTACALHNPRRPTAAFNDTLCRNLTTNNTNFNNNAWISCSAANVCTADNATRNYWPATYFWYTGGGIWDILHFNRIEIRPETANYSGHGRENRTDCTGGVCTYAQEIQNFANWYQYYRSRVLTARAGIGKAFAAQGTRIRVGFGAINKTSSDIDGVSTRTVVRGVRLFSGTNRNNFFSDLYDHNIPAQGTPLRRALDDVGQYYSRTDARGPWSSEPGGTTGTFPTCRQSYTILMTDGYWTEGDDYSASTADARANNDGTNGPTITGPNSATYTYSAKAPFNDTRSNTLADVAMYYWKRDLNTSIENRVPTNLRDPAFWQHMVTFGVGLGVTGSVTQTDVETLISNGTDPGWTDPVGSNPGKLDDLLHAAANGRGKFFSAQNPTTFADALKKILDDIVNRISSAASVVANSTRLTTISKVFSATFNTNNWTGELNAYSISASGLSTTPAWQASQNIPSAASRAIYTYFGNTGVAFSTSTPSLSTKITNDVIDYIRGDRSKEAKNGGSFRDRAGLLGDLVHSSPYHSQDTNTVFIGSNDGMLHAFDADNGKELFGYIPGAVLPKLSELSKPNYEHKYYVDGDIAVTSFARNFLKTSHLVATMGRGGKGLFGLDVSNPAAFSASDVKWEYTEASTAGKADGDLGYMLGKPVIANLNNTAANAEEPIVAAIVGNGYNSINGSAVLYIIDIKTGDLIRKIDTGIAGDNGLAAPGLWDEDGDGLVDYVYAGDRKGNVWKFDLSSSKTSEWNASSIFIAKDSTGKVQPITSEISLARNYLRDDPNFGKVFAFFGTGSYFTQTDPGDKSVIQTWYGIITTPTNTAESISGRGLLKQRTISQETTADGLVARIFSSGVKTPTHDMQGKLGWYIDLLKANGTNVGERMVTGSTLYRFQEPVLVASSIVPVADDPCQLGSGFLNAINAFTGASLTQNFFEFSNYTGSGIVGSLDLNIGLISQAAVLASSTAKGKVIVSGSGNNEQNPTLIKERSINTGVPPRGRLSWRELIRY